MDDELYNSRRQEFVKIREDSFDSFDKTIFPVTTGSLVLSITFIDKIGKPFDDLTLRLILIAWGSWTIVLILNLASYIFARKNADKQIEDLNKRYLQSAILNCEIDEKNFFAERLTNWCNSGAFYFFFVAIICFVIYSTMTFLHYKDISIQKGGNTVTTQSSKTNGKTDVEQRGKTASSQSLKASPGKTQSTQQVSIKKK